MPVVVEEENFMTAGFQSRLVVCIELIAIDYNPACMFPAGNGDRFLRVIARS
jgi:hypothetical protein